MNINKYGPWMLLLVFVIGAIVSGSIGNSEIFDVCVIGAIVIGAIIVAMRTDLD